jgi:ATP-binding cassette subfamily C protein CydCD
VYFDSRLWVFTTGLRARIALSIAIGLLAAAAGVARLALLGWLISRVFRGDALSELGGAIALVAAVMVLRGALEYWRTMLAHRTAALVQKRIRRTLYEKAIELGPAWFGLERTGDVMLAVVDGVEQLETYFGEFLPQIVVASLTPIAIFACVAFVDLPVALALVAGALVALFAPAAFHRLDRKASIRRSRSYARFGAEFLDSVQGLATLKAFGQAGTRGRALAQRAHELAAGTLWVNATNALGRGITDAGIAVGAAGALWLGATRVSDGAMSIGALLVVLMMGVELFRPLRDLRAQLHTGMLGQAAAQAIFRILDAEPAVRISEAATAAVEGDDIEFDNVSFAYPGNEHGPHRGLSFRIDAGERVAIVGASGTGKSSIVRLLLRFYDPQQGAVRVGGKDLRDLGQQQLRSLFAVVNQDTYLFHGTVAENLRLGKADATQEELRNATGVANAHEFIARLPQGYDTVVGERGIKLSGGQRQRIAIARALLCEAPILILDEALSAVDAENESVIQQALNRLMRGRTTLIAAHRLSSVIDADRILVLTDGRIAQQGDHTTLIAHDGPYRQLMGEQAAERPDYAIDATLDEVQASQTLDDQHIELQTAEQEPTNAIVHVSVRHRQGHRVYRRGRIVRADRRACKCRRHIRRSGSRAGADGAAGRSAALAGKLVRTRYGVQAARRHAHPSVRQTRKTGTGLPAAAAHRRSGRDGNAGRGNHRVLLRAHRGARFRRRAGSRCGTRDAVVLRLAAGTVAGAVSGRCRVESLSAAQAPRPAWLTGTRGTRRTQRACGGFDPGAG